MNQPVNSFAASLVRTELETDPVGGRIVVSPVRFQFQSEAVTFDIPLSNLEMRFEERGPGIFFWDSTRPEMELYTVEHAILRNPAIKGLPAVAALLGRREVSRALRLTGYFLGGCVVATWIGSLVLSAMTQAIVARVPMAWEDKIGEQEMARLKSSGRLLNDSNDVVELKTVCAPLIAVLPAERREVRFYIADDPEPNAFALPGGHVVVNAGLLRIADKPEDILGVLAHELSHETKRHAIRRIVTAAGPLVIFGVFLHSGSGAGNLLAMGSGMMVFEGFSQAYETEADETGWDYLVAANIDPRGMIEMFQKLEAIEDKQQMRGVAPAAFESHPAVEERLGRLQRKWEKLPHKSGFLELPPVKWSVITNTAN